jgi:putative ABC transport system permease protein
MERGLPLEEAHRQARIELGGAEQVKEQVRDVRIGVWLDSVRQDLRYGLRKLRNSPGFAATSVFTLALGTGVNATAFGLVESAFLRAMPFRQLERLARVNTANSAGEIHTPSAAEFVAVRKYAKSFEQVSGLGWTDYFYDSSGSSGRTLPGLLVTANWLPTLGVQPFLGRNFVDEEQTEGRDTSVMLSYRCWRELFHGDLHILGRQIVLNRRSVTVVAVLPQSVGAFYEDADIFGPLVVNVYAEHGIAREGIIRVQTVARLKPGVSLDQARAEVELIAQELRPASASNDRSGRLFVEDFSEMFRNPGPTEQNAQRGIWLMAGAAGVVLLIACANVASLLLGRGIKRQREIAVRSALGCSRARMIRQLLTESTLLFLCGGALGLLIARSSEDIVTSATSGIIFRETYVHIDWTTLLVSLTVCLLGALLFGMIPALQATRASLNDGLKSGLPSTTGGLRPRRSRNLLVVFQVALGMVLLVGFGLLFRSLRHVESAPVGFDSRNVLTATVTLPVTQYANPQNRARLMLEALDRVRVEPGVESAGIVDSLSMGGADASRMRIQIPSSKPAFAEEETWFVSVSPGYFDTLRVPILAGRAFRDTDRSDSAPVAIVNQTFANQYFSGASPIGYHLTVLNSAEVSREIVGVVSDFRQRNPEEDLKPLAYFRLRKRSRDVGASRCAFAPQRISPRSLNASKATSCRSIPPYIGKSVACSARSLAPSHLRCADRSSCC